MHHRGRRVLSSSEGKEEEHLDALGQAGIHVAGDGMEAVLPQIAPDQAEVIARSIEAKLRRHGVKEIQDEKYSKYHTKDDLVYRYSPEFSRGPGASRGP